jgi:hypothetical protein
MPRLMEKMYSDGKYAAKKKQRANEAAEKKAKAKKKKEEADKKRKLLEQKKKKNKKKKPMTFKEKMGASVGWIICSVFAQLFFIYYQGGWLDIILKSTKNSQFVKEYFADGDTLPYQKTTKASVSCKEIRKLLPERDAGAPATVNAVGAAGAGSSGGGRKKRRYKQTGGGFNKAENDKKVFLDPTKYGTPYNFIENDNFLMNGIGEYFKTFWQYQRGGMKKITETVNDSLFKDHKDPQNIGEQALDYVKFAIILPIVNIITFIAQIGGNFGLLFWAAFNNQTLLIVPLFIAALCFIFGGWMTGFFWPWGLFTTYLTVFILKPNPQKWLNFATYGRRYKWMWCFLLAFWWLIGIGYIWDWNKNALAFIGTVCALFLLGMLGISNLI